MGLEKEYNNIFNFYKNLLLNFYVEETWDLNKDKFAFRISKQKILNKTFSNILEIFSFNDFKLNYKLNSNLLEKSLRKLYIFSKNNKNFDKEKFLINFDRVNQLFLTFKKYMINFKFDLIYFLGTKLEFFWFFDAFWSEKLNNNFEKQIYYSVVYFFILTPKNRNFFKSNILTYYSKNLGILNKVNFVKKSSFIS